MFGFGSMSPFFHDEYLFNDDQKPRKKRKRRDDDGDYTERKRCLDCGTTLKIGSRDPMVVCWKCSSRFLVRRGV